MESRVDYFETAWQIIKWENTGKEEKFDPKKGVPSMDVALVNPFLVSIQNVMETMLKVSPECHTPYAKTDNCTSGDISGVIGFAERNCSGGVVLSFPKVTALKVYSLLTGEDCDMLGPNVQDAIGEMANMVAGGAKSEFSKGGISFNLSIPTVIVGNNHSLCQLADSPIIVIPMSLFGEAFTMEVSMKISKNRNAGSAR